MAKAKKKKTVPKKKKKHVKENEGPDFMVQVSDPKMLRKDLLEALREIILFMQGYEKFRMIQEQKVAVFSALKNDVKEINLLIDHKLRKIFPKGKLKVATESPQEIKHELEVEEEEHPGPAKEAPKAAPAKKPAPRKTELDELETQLRDIEGQLRKVQ